MSGYAVTPAQQDIYTALVAWLQTVTGLASGLVIQGPVNRASMPPPVPGFVAMLISQGTRLRTNVDNWSTTDPNPVSLTVEQGTKIRVQFDFWGASAWDWATTVQALMRDESTVTALQPTCEPLYADDPLQAPLDDSEDQYELRAVLQAYFQYNPVVIRPQDFAQAGSITIINVDEAYPT